MTQKINGHLEGQMHASHALQNMADALPALGIVAAVLGVVKTMGSLNEPPAVLGLMIGGALVGTFLGVLLAYGIFGPLASRLKGIYEEEIKYQMTIKAVLVAHLHGLAPQVSIETGRNVIDHHMIPSFKELEEKISALPPV